MRKKRENLSRSRSPSPPPSRPRTASPTVLSRKAFPWIPNGPLLRSPGSLRHKIVSSSARRRKAKLYTHVFLAQPNLSPRSVENAWWLYGSFEYRMQCSSEEAHTHVFRMIDKLVKVMLDRHNAKAHEEEAIGDEPPEEAMPSCRGNLIFDLIATKNQIQTGMPHGLGRDIYKYVEKSHACLVTTFVGLTDNPARRVGRDLYSHHEELSDYRQKSDMASIDNAHLFVIYPE